MVWLLQFLVIFIRYISVYYKICLRLGVDTIAITVPTPTADVPKIADDLLKTATEYVGRHGALGLGS